MSTINFPINVGINQPNPQYSLDIIGSLNVATSGSVSGSTSNLLITTASSYIGNGNNSLTITNTNSYIMGGNVGIGTNAPLDPLHVYGPLLIEGSPTPRIYAKSNDGSNSLVFDRYTGQSNYSIFFGENTDTGNVYFRGVGAFSFGNQASPVLFATGSNRVGINNINPQYTLDVSGTINAGTVNSIVMNCVAITASLDGTATNAVSATNANTASVAMLAVNSTSAVNALSANTASAVIGPVNATLFQLPYSSSAHVFNVNYATGSAYFETVTTASGSTNLLFVFNGTRWTSASLA